MLTELDGGINRIPKHTIIGSDVKRVIPPIFFNLKHMVEVVLECFFDVDFAMMFPLFGVK